MRIIKRTLASLSTTPLNYATLDHIRQQSQSPIQYRMVTRGDSTIGHSSAEVCSDYGIGRSHISLYRRYCEQRLSSSRHCDDQHWQPCLQNISDNLSSHL